MAKSLWITRLLVLTMLIAASVADTPDCPYPCLPPPTAGLVSYPPPPPAATGGGIAGYPPPQPGYQLTPPGVVPGYLAPPYYANPAPPPPNPILPWFPWYYRHDNPITSSSTPASSAAVSGTVTRMVVLLPVFLVVQFLCCRLV